MTFRKGGPALALAVWGGALSCDGKDDSAGGGESDADTDTDTDSDTDSDTDTDTDTDTDPSDATLVMNELLALNNTTNVDEAGQYEDWIELYNTGSAAIDLGGFQLTDDPEKTTRWSIPAGNSIAAGGWFLIWCDDDAGDGELHASFQLQGEGEEIALYDADGALVDEVSYDQQKADISWARSPDGGDTWQASTPTPLASNP
jgi:hypothetical protein